MKEVITLQIGQGGSQMGHSMWELLTAEHGLTVDGQISEPIQDRLGNDHMTIFFQESWKHKFVPRALFVDMEPSVIDEIRTGSYRTLFHPDKLITGMECSAGNFARGLFNSGSALIKQLRVHLRREFERCDGLQAFVIARALGGGCGTGTTVALCDLLLDYAKITRMELPIYPSPTLATSTVEPYNAILGEHYCMEDIDVGLLFDNEALYDICSKFIGVRRPAYSNLNRLIAQIVSNITGALRFDNVLNNDIATLQTNLVPYPRIHFPMCNFAPIISSERNAHEPLNVKKLVRSVFDQNNQTIKCDMRNGKFMSCSLFMRGDINEPDTYATLLEVKRRHIAPFIDWNPTGFKIGIVHRPPVVISASCLCRTERSCTMIANHTSVGQAWSRLLHKYQCLFKKRAFLHWYVGEGLEEGEFKEAMDNIMTLVHDYDEIIADDKMGNEGGEGGNEDEDEEEGDEDESEPEEAEEGQGGEREEVAGRTAESRELEGEERGSAAETGGEEEEEEEEEEEHEEDEQEEVEAEDDETGDKEEEHLEESEATSGQGEVEEGNEGETDEVSENEASKQDEAAEDEQQENSAEG